jgi:cardiolipin synthase (CMP-forming)
VPRWIPNALSGLRLALIPVWLALAIIERNHALDGLAVSRGPLLWVLFLIGLTDVLDGTIARRLGLESHLGAMMDAIADKFATLFAVTFLTFFAEPAFTPLPIWLWVVLMARDFALLVGVVMLRMKKKPIDASHVWEGRMATLLLFAVVLMSCWGAPRAAVTAGSLVVVGLVIAGMWQYLGRGLATLRARVHRHHLHVPPHATPGHR